MKRNPGYFRLLYHGLIWGFAELTLGSLLHALHFPYKGMVMTGIGLAIIGMYLRHNRTVWHPIVIGVIASGVKCAAAPLMGIPLGSRAVINPVAAIITEATVVSVTLMVSPLLVTGYQRLSATIKDKI